MHPLLHFHRNYLEQTCEAEAAGHGDASDRFPWLSFYSKRQLDYHQDQSGTSSSSRRKKSRRMTQRDSRQRHDEYTKVSPGSEPHTPSR
eukprot:COSAG02_NODE_224_length_28285_cov_39.533066_5_plen_89_part_00